jgi:predicted HicB family RNase H-like nuclease
MKGKGRAARLNVQTKTNAPVKATEKKKLTIRLAPDMHRALRILALELGRSADAIVTELIAVTLRQAQKAKQKR